MTRLKANQRYGQFLASIKERIRKAQYDALKVVNKELIALYWDLGRMIVDRQKKAWLGKSNCRKFSGRSAERIPGDAGFFRSEFMVYASVLYGISWECKTPAIGWRN